MTETVTQPAQDAAEQEALAAARAGYARKAAHAPTPAVETVEPPLADAAPAPAPKTGPSEELNLSAEPTPAPIDTSPLLAHFDDLKAEVRAMKQNGVDAKTLSELNGAIGDINRQLKELAAAKKEDAPAAESKLAAALKRAKEKAAEYPELGQPMVEAIEELAAEFAAKPQATPPAPEPVAQPAPKAPVIDLEAERQAAREAAAREALLEIHPDYVAVRRSEEFNKWFAAKPAEYQKKAMSSWNPAVVAQPVTEFKAWKDAQKRKQDRLDAAATEQGTAAAVQPTTLPDEEGYRRGYARASRHRL